MTPEDSAAGPASRVLVILAHPDDPEFFCGGTVARWAAEGRKISYCLLTRGDKGADRTGTDPQILARTREAEQRAAARVLGVLEVIFLDYPDGYLMPDLALRKDIVGVIRRVRPDIVITCDPTNFFPSSDYINHPDHRAAGQATLDAVFPAAGSGMFFPELEREQGLTPHRVSFVYVAEAQRPNTTVDVTAYLDRKVAALREHKSQIEDVQGLDARMREWLLDPDSPPDSPRYVEQFQRIDLS
jgi:LmbE family N-acetylglucosaminyl deacetylase